MRGDDVGGDSIEEYLSGPLHQNNATEFHWHMRNFRGSHFQVSELASTESTFNVWPH